MTKEQEEARKMVIDFQFQNPPLMFDVAKQCAIICVDKILSFLEDDREEFSFKTHYQKVKKEIELL